MATATQDRIEPSDVKAAAKGRVLDILVDVAGFPREVLDGRHHKCPLCGGQDRFRLVDAEAGAARCNQCRPTRCGDFLSVVEWTTKRSFPEALQAVAEYLGMSPNRNGNKPVDLMTAFCRRKNIAVESLKAYAATIAKRGDQDVIRLPMVNQKREETGHQDYGLTNGLSKGLSGKGSKAGLFLPGRLPKPGDTVLIVEGVKDAAALHGLGYFAVGSPGTVFHSEWGRAFRGCRVVLIPDRDKASYPFFDRVARLLAGVAEIVARADLPFEMQETGGKDTRDLLSLHGGADELSDIIDAALGWEIPADVSEEESKPEAFKMRRITAAELAATDFKLEYLIDFMLVKNQPCIIAGWKKQLKTSLSIDLAVSLACAGCFLGRFQVNRKCRVGLVSGESGMATIQETSLRICESACRRLSDIDNLIFSDTIPQIADPQHLHALREFCEADELDTLILDPTYLMLDGGDAGNLFIQGRMLRNLNNLCQQIGVTLLIVHHNRKTREQGIGKYDPPELEDIAWAGFQEFARQWLLLGRRSPYEDGSGTHDLWLRVGGSVGFSSLWGLDIDEGLPSDPSGRHWNVTVQSGHDIIAATRKERVDRRAEKQKREEQEGQKAIVEAMSTKLERGEAVFLSKIRAITWIGEVRLKRLLEQLIDQKIVEPCSALRSPTHKNPQEGAFRLSDDWWKDE
jgi:hypothetical protein